MLTTNKVKDMASKMVDPFTGALPSDIQVHTMHQVLIALGGQGDYPQFVQGRINYGAFTPQGECGVEIDDGPMPVALLEFFDNQVDIGQWVSKDMVTFLDLMVISPDYWDYVQYMLEQQV